MTKAWLACMLVCGISMQAHATVNNNYATDVKELLKPASLDNVFYTDQESNVKTNRQTMQAGSSSINQLSLLPTSSSDKSDPDTLSVKTSLEGKPFLTTQESEDEALTDLDNQVVFNKLTTIQTVKLANNIGEIFKTLDSAELNKLKSKFNLTTGQEHNFDHAQVLPILIELANLPNATALTYLGDLYKHGDGVIQDQVKAFSCYKQAASLGDSTAMNKLGECFSYGVGCESNLETAATWYMAAANKGNVEAQFNLGYVYEFGEGVPLNSDKARYWYEKAAAQHHADSMFFLGQMYLDGDGVPFDEVMAKDYFGRACDLGSTDGCDLYQVMLTHN